MLSRGRANEVGYSGVEEIMKYENFYQIIVTGPRRDERKVKIMMVVARLRKIMIMIAIVID